MFVGKPIPSIKQRVFPSNQTKQSEGLIVISIIGLLILFIKRQK